jgi:hypothetical protein
VPKHRRLHIVRLELARVGSSVGIPPAGPLDHCQQCAPRRHPVFHTRRRRLPPPVLRRALRQSGVPSPRIVSHSARFPQIRNKTANTTDPAARYALCSEGSDSARGRLGTGPRPHVGRASDPVSQSQHHLEVTPRSSRVPQTGCGGARHVLARPRRLRQRGACGRLSRRRHRTARRVAGVRADGGDRGIYVRPDFGRPFQSRCLDRTLDRWSISSESPPAVHRRAGGGRVARACCI